VLDIAHAHCRALENIGGVTGKAFNIGTGAGHSIRDVRDAARLVTGSKIAEKAFLRRPCDPAILVANGEKMRRELGWQPSHSSPSEIVKSAWIWKQSRPEGYVSPSKPATGSLLASTP